MGRKYDLAIFDMDGTLTKVRSSWCYIHDCLGVDNTEAYNAFVNMEIDEHEFMRRDIAMWMNAQPGIKSFDISMMMRDIPLISGIQETIATLKYNGIACVICSGGLGCAAKMLCEEYGFDEYLADELETNDDGTLTGEGIQIVNLRNKGKSVVELIKKYSTTSERTISIGNSFTDISMFEKTGYSIAFNPVDQYTAEAAKQVVESDNISDILEFVLFEL